MFGPILLNHYRLVALGLSFDLPAVHIFKIWGGQIHEIEALGFLAPYLSPSGWGETLQEN